MDFYNILSVVINTFGNVQNEIEIDWIGNIIKSLIEGCGSIGLGIIVFTLILKLITLPFDIYSRFSTKKNNVKMEKMRPELEKLQRQYANNKEMYNMKLQNLYKENGYNAFGACLPSILTMVIFIIVIGQFSTYSNYANLDVFIKMTAAYNNAVENYNETTNTEYLIKEDDQLFIDLAYYYENSLKNNNDYKFLALNSSENKYDAQFTLSSVDSQSIELLAKEIEKYPQLSQLYKVGEHILVSDGVYSFNNEKFTKRIENQITDGEGNVQTVTEVVNMNNAEIALKLCTELVEKVAFSDVGASIKNTARDAAAEVYRNTDLSFLWVKNIWCQDLPWAHPIRASFSEYAFRKSSGCAATCAESCGNANNSITDMSEIFNEITANMEKEKSEPNGYLILVILSIAIMLVSQLVMQKTQKAQMELSSVEGENSSAAMSSKMMLWMMPIMFGFFSFMYTASFSIYIIISSAVSLLSTLIINYLVEKSFEKLAKKEAEELELKRTGRISQIQKNKKDNKKK